MIDGVDDQVSFEYALYQARRQFDKETILRRPVSPGPGHYDTSRLPVEALQTIRPLGGTFGFSKRPVCDTSFHSDDVGPGSYSTPRAANAGPRFSFGTSPARAGDSPRRARSEERPGPGAYTMPSDFERRDIVTSSFGKMTGAKGEIKQSKTPGPGTYEAEEIKSKVGVFIGGKSGREEMRREMTPGPGDYAPEMGQGKAKGSTKGIIPLAPRMPNQKTHTAGPGSYEIGKPLDDCAPHVKIPTAGRKPLYEKYQTTPGPGAYNVLKKKSVKQVPKIAYITPHGLVAPNMKTPGPGHYESKQHKSAAPKWSMLARPNDMLPPKVPGPGAYEIGKSDKEHIPGGKFTKGAKLVPENPPLVPGPGAYEWRDLTSVPSVPQTSSARITDQVDVSKLGVPGPGAYTAMQKSRGPAAVISTSDTERGDQPKNTPGPGAYSPSVAISETGAPVSFALAKREGLWKDPEHEGMPGPGAYVSKDLDKSSKIEKAPVIRSRSVPIPPTSEATPGPGAYTATWQTERAPVAVIPMASRDHVEAIGPGPGAYEVIPKSGVEGTAYSFGREIRADTTAPISFTPGPGAYDPTKGAVDQEGSAKYTIPKAERTVCELEGKTQHSPGPGSYTVAPEKPQGFTIAGRHASMSSLSTPGPGAYTDFKDIASPAYTFGKNERFNEETSNQPGPGQYVPLEVGTKPHGAIIGTEKRELHQVIEGPGPGSYTTRLKTTQEGGTIGKAERREPDKNTDTPGPGDYVVPPLRPLAQAASFPLGPMRLETTSLTPGPGAYTSPNFADPHGAFMASAPREEKTKEHTPGPGAYAGTKPFGSDVTGVHIGLPLHGGFIEGTGPGPGDYTIPTYKGTAVPIATATRGDVFPTYGDTPGPGAYSGSQTTLPTGPSFSLSGPHIAPAALMIPGPGAYHSGGMSLPRPPLGSIPKEERKLALVPPDSASLPGPGAYHVTLPSVGPSIGFPQAEKFPDVSQSLPGPGQYLSMGIPGAGAPHWTIAPRHEEPSSRNVMLTPGPGAYQHTALTEHVTGGIMGPPRHPDPITTSTPGPGAYTHDKTRVTDGVIGGTISTAPRPEFPVPMSGDTTTTPGPGAYMAKQEANVPGGKFHAQTSERFPSNGGDSLPGPGAYHAQAPAYAPGGLIPKAPRSVPGELEGGGPGPGAYNLAGGLTFMGKDHVPQVVMSGGFQPEPTANTPGPGAYNGALDSGPSISFPKDPHRYDFPIADGPGPGAYQHDTKPKNPTGGEGVSISTVGFAVPHKDPTPGPGQYDAQRYSSHVPGGITSQGPRECAISDADPIKSDTPGPGHYNSGDNKKLLPGGVFYGPFSEPPERKEHALMPGPGTYAPAPLASGLQMSIGKAERGGGPQATGTHEATVTATPGPGSYGDTTFVPKGNGLLFPVVVPIPDPCELNPGPGAYDVSKHMKNGPQYSMAPLTSERAIDILPPPEEVYRPGPGQYEDRKRAIDPKKGVSWSRLKAAARPATSYTNPYNAPGLPPNGPGLDPSIPPPGTYEPSGTVSDHTHKHQIHTDLKQQAGRDYPVAPWERWAPDVMDPDQPGPGQYRNKPMVGEASGGAIEFGGYSHRPGQLMTSQGMVTRLDLPDTFQDTPGPGQYRQPKGMGQINGKTIPGVSIGERPFQKYDPGTMGPGHYDPKYNAAAKYFPYDATKYS